MKQLLDKNSTISKILTELSTRANRISQSKANIWLNIGLYGVKLVFFYTAFLSPFTAYAGVFSFISSLVESKEADADINRTTSQFMGVLEAHVGPTSASKSGEISIVDGGALMQEAGVVGTQADLTEIKPTQISLYVVRQGDSLSQIAQMYGVSVNTIVWANGIKGAIREGDELVILPISGVSHTIGKGDTIRSIAAKYKADSDDILSFNDMKAGDSLKVGSIIIIPDGEVQAAPLVSSKSTAKLRSASGPTYKDYYMRPIVGGVRSQGLHGYNGVDLAAPIGTPIYASADGAVIVARSSGYNGGYGSYIVISHPNGTQTLYAHASKVSVSQGDVVVKGQVIGLVGNTGKSTGPHVHFEIRGAANPF
jgi:murein DD-endopeptidase MepM/ murein hydrolase activator NlpD